MIDIQNFYDNECFEWCLVRYSNPACHYPTRMRKIDKLFGDELDFEYINVPVKTKDIHKIEKKNSIVISACENKEK